MKILQNYSKLLLTVLSAFGLVACQGGGGGNNAGGNAPAKSGSGIYKSCMISSAKNNAASEYSTMCFNIPEESSSNICDNGVFGGEYSEDTSTSDDGGDGNQESNTETTQTNSTATSGLGDDTTENNVVEDNFSKGNRSSLKLADDETSGSKLHFRPNANFCQIIKPLAKACAVNIDGSSTNVYFSSLDVSENEAASLCANTIGGTLKAVDITTTTPNNNGPDTNGPVNNDPNNTTDPDKNDPNKDPDNSVTAPSGLAASLAATLKDCGDDATPPEYCNKGKLGDGPRFILNNPGSEIQQGFVDVTNNRLVVVTGPHLEQSGILPQGQDFTSSVMAVDLSTGERSVISGLKIDVANGNEIVGTGPIPGEVRNVRQGSDGKLYIKSDLGDLLSIDPATGNRTLVKQFPSEQPITACFRAENNLAFTMDDKGNFFIPYKVPGGAGVIKFDSNADECTYLTASNDGDAGTVGTGPAINDNMVNLEYKDGFLYGTVFLGRIVAKIATDGADAGKRSLVSSVERDVGSGDSCHGTTGFAISGNTIFQGGAGSSCPYGPSVMKITMDGERSAPKPGVGWENPPGEVLRVFAIPGSEDIFLGATESEIMVIDWTKKKAWNLSNNK